MNLYLRLAWTLLRCIFLSEIKPTDTLIVRRRVWLNDLDINMHMNNGRYLTVVDLSLIEFFARTGFLMTAFKQKWRPMAGGAVTTFRKGLGPWQAYELRFRWLSSEGSWNYMGYEFVRGDRVHAAGILKGGMVGPHGLIDCKDALAAMPETWQSLATKFLQLPSPPEIVAWQQAEQGIYAASVDRTRE